MKNEKVENKKIHKADKPHSVSGVQVRSGVKAGRLGDDEFGSQRGPSLGDDKFGTHRHDIG